MPALRRECPELLTGYRLLTNSAGELFVRAVTAVASISSSARTATQRPRPQPLDPPPLQSRQRQQTQHQDRQPHLLLDR
ncbi:uncharacterized protein N7459_008480 [Penicillium hispanicum]|uniref:uncharacterized protein n=1 Tax=Penicillium hispanicum TaxID=1080232 RepID=UPI0025420B65|nr:uncharacterized protein N7459_008480 [Penicillium hispanicum]KAJ5574053.1 hypothetical protein N7459_008480 [Penicillium hispanicum]